MPEAQRIFEGLTQIANSFLAVAIVWHALVLAAVVAIVWLNWRPTQRAALRLLSLPTLSVGVLAWEIGNPFNAVTFGFLTLVSLVAASQSRAEQTRPGPAWAVALGSGALAYAYVYPHFLQSKPFALYLIASPMGLVPCPTLSLVLGFGLIGDGLGSRPWSLIMGSAGLFYGLFGMLRLGVALDAGLLAGSLAVVTLARRLPREKLGDLPTNVHPRG